MTDFLFGVWGLLLDRQSDVSDTVQVCATGPKVLLCNQLSEADQFPPTTFLNCACKFLALPRKRSFRSCPQKEFLSMDSVDLQPDDVSVKRYYDKLNDYRNLDETHEGTVKAAFQHVLEDVGQDLGWTLVQEHFMQERSIRVDGALKNEYNLYHGYWEAKDSDDDLQKEVTKKLEKDYPKKNTVFQAPDRAVLIQGGGIASDGSIEAILSLRLGLRFGFNGNST